MKFSAKHDEGIAVDDELGDGAALLEVRGGCVLRGGGDGREGENGERCEREAVVSHSVWQLCL